MRRHFGLPHEWSQWSFLVQATGLLILCPILLLPGRIVATEWHSFYTIGLWVWLAFGWLWVSYARQASPLHYPTGLILLWLPVNLWASADQQLSHIAAGYLLLGLALFFLINVTQKTKKSLALISTSFLLFGTFIAVASPPIIAWKPEFRLFYFPLYDSFLTLSVNVSETIHANVLASVLVLFFPIFLALLILPRIRLLPWKLVIIILNIYIASLLILTQSRGGYLGIVVAILIISALLWRKLIYITPVLFGFIVIAYRQLGSAIMLDYFSSDGSLGGWEGRLDIWTNSATAFVDFVFTGIGIGSFTILLPLLYPLRVDVKGFPHAHNLFLQVGLDLGLPGLIAYLAILINLYVMLWQMLRHPQDIFKRALTIGATGSLTAMLVHGTLDTGLWGTKLAFLPWVLFALIALLHREHQEQLDPQQIQ